MNAFSSTLCSLALAGIASAQNSSISLTNGIDGYVEVPYTAQVAPQAGITVEAWITYDDTTLPSGYCYPTIFRQNLTAGGESFFLRVNADNLKSRILRWLVVTPSGRSNLDWSFATGQLNTWTHVAATYDGTNQRLFVNGVQVATKTFTGRLVNNGGPLRIAKGSDIGGPIEVWNGRVDEARLWPFARTAAEIFGSMGAELSSMPGKVATWNLNGSFVDSSSAGLNATMAGSVAFTTNAPTLAARPFLGTTLGASTNGCLGDLALAVTGTAQPGNAGFGVATQRVPVSAVGALLLGPLGLPIPLRIVGIDVWVDPATLVTVSGTADALGALRFALPIPVGLTGAVAAQLVAADPCGSQGLTASSGLLVLITP